MADQKEGSTPQAPEPPAPPEAAPMPDAASILAFMQGTATIVRELATITRDVSAAAPAALETHHDMASSSR